MRTGQQDKRMQQWCEKALATGQTAITAVDAAKFFRGATAFKIRQMVKTDDGTLPTPSSMDRDSITFDLAAWIEFFKPERAFSTPLEDPFADQLRKDILKN